MSKITRLEQVTSWKRALNAARRTIGKSPLDKEPSLEWEAKILLAEHSPIRLVEYEWTWEDIKQWTTAHYVRHHVGVEKFVHSQREDRRNLDVPRDELPQGSLNDMDMTANAQALINISKVRLCKCASKETREAWNQVKEAIREIDPVMSDKMVPSCQYRGFCPELKSCGYCGSLKYKLDRLHYLRTDYNDSWTEFDSDYEVSRFGEIRDANTEEIQHLVYNNGLLYFNGKSVDYIVAKTFLPNPEHKSGVLHKNGNTLDNAVWNLEWI